MFFLFFFFKQKTAYEMLRSLVGSEMCIRDRWNGVTTGDFDGDGRLDIVASNWGRNTVYQGYRAKPLQLFYGDVDDNGTFEAIITCFDEQLGQQVPFRGLDYLGKALPLLRERFR